MHLLAKWETDGGNLQILGVWKLSWKMQLCWNQNTLQSRSTAGDFCFKNKIRLSDRTHFNILEYIFLNS